MPTRETTQQSTQDPRADAHAEIPLDHHAQHVVDPTANDNPLNTSRDASPAAWIDLQNIDTRAFAETVEAIQDSIRDQLQGKTFGAGIGRLEMYGFSPLTSYIDENTRVKIDAAYSRAANDIIAAHDMAPKLSPTQDHVILVVHQFKAELQAQTAAYLAEKFPGVPTIGLISANFIIDHPDYLRHFADESGSGLLYSGGGRIDFKTEDGESLYRPLLLNMKRIDVAGGFLELCQRRALIDALSISIEQANRMGERADIRVNFLPDLTYKNNDEGGAIQLLQNEIPYQDSPSANNTMFFNALRSLPPEFKGRLPANWRDGPPYVFESKAGNRITVSFDR